MCLNSVVILNILKDEYIRYLFNLVIIFLRYVDYMDYIFGIFS